MGFCGFLSRGSLWPGLPGSVIRIFFSSWYKEDTCLLGRLCFGWPRKGEVLALFLPFLK